MTPHTPPTTGIPERLGHFIGGQHVSPVSGEYFASSSPATLEVLYEAAKGTAADVEAAVAAARRAFEAPSWRSLSATKRGHLLRALAAQVEEHAEELAVLESQDNGKLLREMRGQMATLPEYLYYYAGAADKLHGEQIPASNTAILNYTLREPLGVVGAITPWNSPLTLTVSKLAPAIATGNTIVVKPSEYTSRSVLRLAELASAAGFPDGVFNVVTGYGKDAGAALVDHPDIAKLSFTGSTGTGSAIGAAAGSRFIGSTLELGGKSPQIVFDDADLHNAAMGIVAGIFAAAGQTCIAGSRVFAHASVYEELLSAVADRAESIHIGDPLKDETELGPLAFEDQLSKVDYYVRLAEQEGLEVRSGGTRPQTDLPGYFYSPTILTGADNTQRSVREEIFGPVVAVMPFHDEEEVVRKANDTEFGLAAGVWTSHLGRAHRMAAALDAGTIWINTYRAMSPLSPRQGFKSSGTGVEHGMESLLEYTRLKSVWVNTDDSPVADPFIMRS